MLVAFLKAILATPVHRERAIQRIEAEEGRLERLATPLAIARFEEDEAEEVARKLLVGSLDKARERLKAMRERCKAHGFDDVGPLVRSFLKEEEARPKSGATTKVPLEGGQGLQVDYDLTFAFRVTGLREACERLLRLGEVILKAFVDFANALATSLEAELAKIPGPSYAEKTAIVDASALVTVEPTMKGLVDYTVAAAEEARRRASIREQLGFAVSRTAAPRTDHIRIIYYPGMPGMPFLADPDSF